MCYRHGDVDTPLTKSEMVSGTPWTQKAKYQGRG